jgi:hypothetical protein
MRIRTKELESVETGVEEGVDLGFGIKDFLLQIWCYEGGLFYRSMLCKWTISLAYTTWVMSQ